VSPRKATTDPQPPPEGYTRVTVAGNYQLNVDGWLYVGGQTADVPTDQAASLVQSGIVVTT